MSVSGTESGCRFYEREVGVRLACHLVDKIAHTPLYPVFAMSSEMETAGRHHPGSCYIYMVRYIVRL